MTILGNIFGRSAGTLRRMSTMAPNPPIAIVGGGPGGLMLARLLQVKGFDYKVFERNEGPGIGAQGGSLDIHTGSGQLALEEAGLLDQFKKIARYDAQGVVIANKQGEVKFDDSDVDKKGDEGPNRPEVDRKALRQLLLDSIPADKVAWNSKVQSVERDAEQGTMSIRLADGSDARGFRLVVGADGLWSKVRPLVTDAKPAYTGYSHFATTLKTSSPYWAELHALVKGGTYMALGEGKQILAQGSSEGSYTIYAGCELPEQQAREDALPQNAAGLRNKLLEHVFAGWGEQPRSMLRHSEGDFYLWALHSFKTEDMSWKTVPGVVLLGDAAHVTTPNGEGVNLAMHDSVELVRQIEKHGLADLEAAVSEYERGMLTRAAAHIEDGRVMADMMQAPDAPRGIVEFIKSVSGGTQE